MVEVQTTDTGAVIPVETPQAKSRIIVPTREKVDLFRTATRDDNKAHEFFDLGYHLGFEMKGLGDQEAVKSNADFWCVRQQSKFSKLVPIGSKLTPSIIVNEETPKGLVLCVNLYEGEIVPEDKRIKPHATATLTYVRKMDRLDAFATTQIGSPYTMTPEELEKVGRSLDYGKALDALPVGLSSHELQRFPAKLEQRIKAFVAAHEKAEAAKEEKDRKSIPEFFPIYSKHDIKFYPALEEMTSGKQFFIATDAPRAEFDARNYCATHTDAFSEKGEILYQVEGTLTIVQKSA